MAHWQQATARTYLERKKQSSVASKVPLERNVPKVSGYQDRALLQSKLLEPAVVKPVHTCRRIFSFLFLFFLSFSCLFFLCCSTCKRFICFYSTAPTSSSPSFMKMNWAQFLSSSFFFCFVLFSIDFHCKKRNLLSFHWWCSCSGVCRSWPQIASFFLRLNFWVLAHNCDQVEIKCDQKNGAQARSEKFCDWHRKDFSSPEEEDGRTPWRAGGLSSKKGELWLILAEHFELHLLQFLQLCSLERSVLVDQDSAFHFFCPCLLFCWESGKDWDGQGLDKYFSALAMAERWILLVVKMRKMQGMWDIRSLIESSDKPITSSTESALHFFGKKKKCLIFGEERRVVAIKWKASYIVIEQVPEEETSRDQTKISKDRACCGFRAMFKACG